MHSRARKIRGRNSGMILAKVKDKDQKEEIMKRKRLLGEKSIYINHDLTRQEREVQKK